MVGRLVKDQQRRVLQEQFRQRDTHLPPAGKLTGVAIHVLHVEADTGEDSLDAGLHLLRFIFFELLLPLADGIDQVVVFLGFGIHLEEIGVGLFDLFLQFERVAEGAFGLGVERAAFHGDPVLGR